MDILQETDTFHPLLLNIGYAIHHSDWNWTEVNSPFFRIYYVTKGMAEVTLPDRTITLSPHHLYIIPAFTCHNCHCEGDFEHYYLHIYEDHSSATSILEDLDFPTIIRKTKCFDFWERNVLFPKTKRSFFRTPTPSTLPFSA